MNYGAKANNLITIRALYPQHVPPFIIVSFSDVIADARMVLQEAEKLANDLLSHRLNDNTLPSRIHAITDQISVNPNAIQTIFSQLIETGWEKISIRTSSINEDGDTCSFAGQYVSFVDVDCNKANLEQYIRSCFASLFSERVLQYAKSQKLQHMEMGGSVILQKMFYGTKSGVLFTEDGKGNITFAATDSWRNRVVDGGDAVTITAPRTTLCAKHITTELQLIAQLGLQLEQHYKSPLDIEWAHDEHTVMLLQARPQTTDTTQYSLTWDATNISENYPNITLPLTYSFIKNLYSHVYPSFFRILGLSEQTLQEKHWIFENSLGYIQGRVYYRIDNWYELVKLIPGSRNQAFFEAMLNPAKKRNAQDKQARTPLTFSFLILSIRLLWILLRSKAYSKKFSKQFASTYQESKRLNWSSMSAEASLDHLQELRTRLLTSWGIPILNDVRVMIFHGIFKTILLKNADQTTYLEHLHGLDDRASIKPLEALARLGKTVHDALELERVSTLDALKTTPVWIKIEEEAQTFIDTFGGRTPDELQLENPRLSEDISNVVSLAFASKDSVLSIRDHQRKRITRFPLSKKLFAIYVTQNMRSAIDFRERFRFNRAQIFGVARTVYLAIGEKFTSENIIEKTKDIFWLTEEEIHAVVRGHSWSYDMKPIIRHRQELFDDYQRQPLRMRVQGHGHIAPRSTIDATPDPNGNSISGIGVALGIVTAPVIVVHVFDPTLDIKGKILVVRHIDPGWTLLLVQAAGVITEQGNALSHVAIVSREISVPAIVGVNDAITRFHTGDKITMNGTTGEIYYVT